MDPVRQGSVTAGSRSSDPNIECCAIRCAGGDAGHVGLANAYLGDKTPSSQLDDCLTDSRVIEAKIEKHSQRRVPRDRA